MIQITMIKALDKKNVLRYNQAQIPYQTFSGGFNDMYNDLFVNANRSIHKISKSKEYE